MHYNNIYCTILYQTIHFVYSKHYFHNIERFKSFTNAHFHSIYADKIFIRQIQQTELSSFSAHLSAKSFFTLFKRSKNFKYYLTYILIDKKLL